MVSLTTCTVAFVFSDSGKKAKTLALKRLQFKLACKIEMFAHKVKTRNNSI